MKKINKIKKIENIVDTIGKIWYKYYTQFKCVIFFYTTKFISNFQSKFPKKKNLEKERKKAIAEGKARGILDIAKKMLEEKVDIDFIIKITGLKKEQILN